MWDMGHARRFGYLGALALVAWVSVGHPATAGRPRVSVADLTLGGASNDGFSVAFDVNARGLAVGTSKPAADSPHADDGEHAFMFHNGRSPVDLGTFGGSFSEAHGINRSGKVVGWSSSDDADFRAFIAERGVSTDLGSLGGSSSFATSINDVGQVVGASTPSGSVNEQSPTHAFLYSKGAMRDLGTLGGSTSWANDISSRGIIVGFASTSADAATHAFVYAHRTMTDLGTLGGTSSSAIGVNDEGEVVGSAELVDGSTHAFLSTEGRMLDLGTLGGTFSEARALNDRGEVVGSSLLEDGATRHAFIWSNNSLVDLNTLLPPNSDWVLVDAYGINAQGQIVGEGYHHDAARNRDLLHAFLLSLR